MSNRKNILELVESRTACSVLDSMRRMDKNKNYSSLASAIEELQDYCNRMEDGLWNGKGAVENAYQELNKGNIEAAKKHLEDRWKKLKERFDEDKIREV